MPYKNDPMRCGVYRLVSPSGKFYIGSSNNFNVRRQNHYTRLRNGKHHSYLLQRAWNRYGEAVKFEPLIICAEENLLFFEQLFLENLKPEYNVAALAGKPHLGKHLSKEHRENISKANKGRILSPGHRAKISAARKGQKMSPERLQKHIQMLRTRRLSAETRAKISAAQIGRKPSAKTLAALHARKGIKNPKMSAAKFGMKYNVICKTRSAETRARIRAAWAIRKAQKGKL